MPGSQCEFKERLRKDETVNAEKSSRDGQEVKEQDAASKGEIAAGSIEAKDGATFAVRFYIVSHQVCVAT